MTVNTRELNIYTNGVEIDHKRGTETVTKDFGGSLGSCTYIPRQEGDVTLDVSGQTDTFNVSLCEDRGRDRDNYPHSHNVDIDLNADEAREVLLALTVWLEGQA